MKQENKPMSTETQKGDTKKAKPDMNKMELHNKVNQVCAELERKGIKVSNTKVRTQTGGDANVVREFVKQWKDDGMNQKAARQKKLTLDRLEAQPIVRALEAFFMQIASEVESEFKDGLEERDRFFLQMKELLDVTVQEVETLQEANQALHESKQALSKENQKLMSG